MIKETELRGPLPSNLAETKTYHTTMGEILGLSSDDPLRLLSSGVKVGVFDAPSSTVYSVAYSYRSFYSQDFIDLLSSARHTKRDTAQTRADIIDDWELVYSGGEGDRQLVKDHSAGLEPFWSEFVECHLPLFLDAVKVFSGQEQEGLLVPQAWKLVKKSYAIANSERLLAEMIKKDYESGEKARSSFNTLRLMLIVSPGLSQEDKDHLTRVGLRDFIVVDDSVPGQYDWPKSIEDSPIAIDYLGEDLFRLKTDNGSYITVSLDQGKAREVERFIVNPQDSAIIPWILWEKDKATGQRRYITSNIPQRLIDRVDERANALLGLLVAASLSPRERGKLPKTRGLPNVSGRQDMMEAQIPFLVSVKRQKILESQLFQAVEAWVDK